MGAFATLFKDRDMVRCQCPQTVSYDEAHGVVASVGIADPDDQSARFCGQDRLCVLYSRSISSFRKCVEQEMHGS